eukprot:5536221-Pyramimonas_sp.AAC.1
MNGVCGIPVGGGLGSGDPYIPPPPDDDDELFEGPPPPPVAELPEPPPPPPAGGRGGPRGAPLVLELPPHGRVNYYTNGQRFTAECDQHSVPCKCVCSRTGRESKFASRAGQGRPLGLLVARLKSPRPDWVVGQNEHVHLWEPDFAARQAARDWLEAEAPTNPIVRGLLGEERRRRIEQGEGSEPLVVPK